MFTRQLGRLDVKVLQYIETVQGQVCWLQPKKRRKLPMILILVLIIIGIWIFCSPVLFTDKSSTEKISADTTLVEPADTVSINDSLLTSSVDSVDTDIQ